MKSMLKYFISTIIGLVTFFSCTDLDENLYSDITTLNYEYTQENLMNVIGPVYSNLRIVYDFINFLGMQEISADAVAQPANASGWYDGGRFIKMHQHKWDSDQGHLNSLWSIFWMGINHSNRAINNINNDIIFNDESTKMSLLAEVKVARAYYYWLAMDNFGGIPIVTDESEEGFPAKESRSNVYQFIVSELNEAIPNLNESTESEMYGRFNKWAAKTLLANVYLNAEIYTGSAQWDNCIEQCNDIINSNKYALEENYSDVFGPDRMGSSEMILGLQYDEILARGNMHSAVYHDGARPKYKTKFGFYGAGAVKAVPQFIDTYDTEDLRLDYTWEMGLQLTPEGDTCRCTYEKKGQPLIYTKEIQNGLYTGENEGYRQAKFPVLQGAYNLTTTYPLFRYAEVLLMKAESLLRTNKTDEAAMIVSNVRSRAFEDPEKAIVTAAQLIGDSKYPWGYYASDYALTNDALEKSEADLTPVQFGGMYDELGWEFAYENHRRRDMIRFGIYTKKSWLSHKPSEDHRIIFPIPTSVVNANPNLDQNPGY
jgi:starch-binding outer membrane protein, SusD/RagB family